MSRYTPKPGPAAPFDIVVAAYQTGQGSRCEVVAIAEQNMGTEQIAAVKKVRPKLEVCSFVVDHIARDGERK